MQIYHINAMLLEECLDFVDMLYSPRYNSFGFHLWFIANLAGSQ